MKEPRPFLEDGSQYGVSRTAFRRMRNAQKRELMIEWFQQNYRLPEELLPRDEGEWVWIWGNPCRPLEELGDKFYDVASEKLIKEVADYLERDGNFEWSPVPYDDRSPDDDDEPLSLDMFSDQPSEEYGTPAERRARADAKRAIDGLRARLLASRPIGMGHNFPPDDDDEAPAEVAVLPAALAELSAEFAKPNPVIAFVKQWAAPLRDALIATGRYAAKKADSTLEAGLKAGAVGVAGIAVAHYHQAILHAFDAVIGWLQIGATVLF